MPRGWPVYLAAAIASILWALAPVLFALNEPRADNATLSILGLLALGPIALVWVAAYLVQQGRRLAAETRHARVLAESLLAPAAIAVQATGTAVEAVRLEIERATSAAALAQSELTTLRDVLAAESLRLIEAATESNRSASNLGQGLASERQKMEALTAAMDARAARAAEAVTSQTKMMTEASDLAETQIREAEAALAARAADLTAAAGEASDAARLAGETLTTQVERLETASASVGDQARAIEEGLGEQRAALVAAAHGMRADHEAHAVEVESLRAQLTEIIAHARGGAAEIGETAAQSADVLRQMIAASSEQLRDLARTAGEERDQLTAKATQSLGMVAELAAREREALEARTRESMEQLSTSAGQARQTAETHVAAARAQVDQLGEIVLVAGQKADAVFEARMAEARQIIEQSAQLVDEAGVKTGERLKAGVEAAQATLAALEAVLVEMDRRLARAPAEAEAHTTAIRLNVERGIEALMVSARHAAEETQNIDAAFQERVRRNYDMLSEAVRLMGVVAGPAGSTSSQRAARPPVPIAAETPPPAVPPPPAPSPAAAPPAAVQAPRQRLKLTPTATDEEFKTVFEVAGGREPAETIGDSWTWKELLSSMDSPSPGDSAALTGALLSEVEAMGIDAAALVPRARIEEIAAALKVGDSSAGRDMVRRLAPAAVRRLSRRMMADRDFHDQAARYVRRYTAQVGDAAKRQGDGFDAAALLGSDQGRAYLLLDAAIIDAA